jgi:hypothetical protein
MKTKTTKSVFPHAEQSTGLERVQFHDGMVVKAEDLETAGQYPVSLLQSVLRSYLGCGVVCGLELGQKKSHNGEPPWIVTVGRGLAVDCAGFPIELTCPIKLDFTPDPCECEPPSDRAYIAIRRTTSDEATSDPCGCAHEAGDKDCDRLRDRALVKAFTEAQLDELPGGVCRRKGIAGHHDCAGETDESKSDGEGKVKTAEGAEKQDEAPVSGWCSALKDCGCCSCDSEWILLGTVTFDEEHGISGVDTKYRRWVKPVEVLCSVDDLMKRIKDLEASVEKLQPKNEDSVKPSEQVLSDGVVTPDAHS